MTTPRRHTRVAAAWDRFVIDRPGAPPAPGPADGLLINARLVQGVFDDLDPSTRSLWAYPDGPWDPCRNNREFVAAMPAWRRGGLDAFTINFQGGSPQGYSVDQPWANPAYHPDGRLRADYAARMERILDRADRLGLVAIVGFFYFGQAGRLRNESAVLRATDEATDWLLERRYTHVLVEIANETGVPDYGHAILSPGRCPELIERVRARSRGRIDTAAGRLPVGTSFPGGMIPPDEVIAVSDHLLVHGNGIDRPAGLAALIDACRASPSWDGQPITVNEDDHTGFERPDNNFRTAIEHRAGWGFFDYRRPGETDPRVGFQSVPVDWRPRSARKRAFFRAIRGVRGGRR